MKASSLRDDRFREAIGSAQRQRGEGNGKARSGPSGNHTTHTESHSGVAAKRIVREWRRVYQNLYET